MKLHFDVAGDCFLSAGEASSQVKKTLKQIGIPADTIRKMAVAMYEAEINMVIHANGGEVDCEIFPDKVMVRLSDSGPGIPDLDKAMEEGYSTASDTARELGFGAGMGLPNMKRFTDEMQITSVVGEGTTVELTVFF